MIQFATSCTHEIASTAPAIPSRQLTAPILGATSPNGDCAPSVADISHEQPTAHITHLGKPGDEISVRITHQTESGPKKDTVQEFTLPEGMVEWQIPTGILNATIHEIVITATVGTGVTGTCRIPVDGISGEPTPLP
ncbi:hypothetical protein OS128_09150 [Corynebacterium sp. P5848]|uniref:hypothetical protein n=1 Tax=Corynebacterium marambiense TaxID=2765364 RepID=UPI002260FAD8|nr:hypothetical protein [Corynebacterium marambiense]MCX7543083.1 hypothetical protein [Corynebacterium marambiense]